MSNNPSAPKKSHSRGRYIDFLPKKSANQATTDDVLAMSRSSVRARRAAAFQSNSLVARQVIRRKIKHTKTIIDGDETISTDSSVETRPQQTQNQAQAQKSQQAQPSQQVQATPPTATSPEADQISNGTTLRTNEPRVSAIESLTISAESDPDSPLNLLSIAADDDFDELESTLNEILDETLSEVPEDIAIVEGSATPDTYAATLDELVSTNKKSPFLTSVTVDKRPLSRSRPRTTIESTIIEEEFSPVSKNIYSQSNSKRNAAQKQDSNNDTTIIESSHGGHGISLTLAIILTIILGATVGAFLYLAFFQA